MDATETPKNIYRTRNETRSVLSLVTLASNANRWSHNEGTFEAGIGSMLIERKQGKLRTTCLPEQQRRRRWTLAPTFSLVLRLLLRLSWGWRCDLVPYELRTKWDAAMYIYQGRVNRNTWEARTNSTDQMHPKGPHTLTLRERNGDVDNRVVHKTRMIDHYHTQSVILALLDGQVLAEKTCADQLRFSCSWATTKISKGKVSNTKDDPTVERLWCQY